MAVTNNPYGTGQPVEVSEQSGASFGTAINVLGAAASLALIVGIGVWGYKLLIRDVSGVPVVRALEGPMRVQPKDPGGRPADHQGLAVNAVAAQGTAEPPADRLMLAPRPVELAEEDQPASGKANVVAEVKPTETTQDAVDEFKSGSVKSLVDQLVAGVVGQESDKVESEQIIKASAGRIVQPKPLNPDTEIAVAQPQPKIETPPEPEAAVLEGPGLSRSLRPQLRPARAEKPTTQAVAAVAIAPLDVDAESLPAGTRLAQLGAFESQEIARSEWDRLNNRFGDYLKDKSRVIQKASSGGRTFYRLRAMGFDDLNDARRFCSVLVAEKADCIPVTTR